MTLNVGGRNTNSFEFEMRGDTSAFGKRWVTLYERAKEGMRRTGPRAAPGLASAIDEVLNTLEAKNPRDPKSVLTRGLNCENWTQCMQLFAFQSKHLVNACNLASLRDGRPAPLEMPENLQKICEDRPEPSDPGTPTLDADARREQRENAANRLPPNYRPAFVDFLRLWLGWLRSVEPDAIDGWRRKADKRKVPLPDAVAAMLIFDAMCFVALLHMHCDAGTTETDPELVADVCEAHLGFHHSLPFTTETGKYMKLVEVLAELRWPEAIMLQEAYDLAAHANCTGDNSTTDAKLFGSIIDKYHVCVADETVLLLRKDSFVDVDDDVATLSGPDSDWRLRMTRRGRELYGEGSQLFVEWQRTLERTVVTRATYIGACRQDPSRMLPTQWTRQPKATGSPKHAVLVALHGKNGSEVTQAFVPELADLVTTAVPGVAYVVGMDSNASDATELSSVLSAKKLLSAAVESACAGASGGRPMTVAKARTIFQTQLRKTDLLDVSLKDFILAWHTDDGGAVGRAYDSATAALSRLWSGSSDDQTPRPRSPSLGVGGAETLNEDVIRASNAPLTGDAAIRAAKRRAAYGRAFAAAGSAYGSSQRTSISYDPANQWVTPIVERIEQFPQIVGPGQAVGYLMPSNQWPYDHAMLLAEVRL